MIVATPSKEQLGRPPVEVLIPEARIHRRHRRLLRAARLAAVLLAVGALLALAVALAGATRSGGAQGVRPLAAGAPGASRPDRRLLTSLPPGILTFSGLTCESALRCVAFGIGGIGTFDEPVALWTRDGGATWTRSTTPQVSTDLTGSLSCVGATCLADAGSQRGSGRSLLARSSDSGASWTVAALPGTKDEVVATACSTVRDCLASSDGGTVRSTDAGRTWSRVPLPGLVALDSVVCPTPMRCVATATATMPRSAKGRPPGVVVASTDGGRTWATVLHLPVGVQPVGVQCRSAADCLVGGDWSRRGALWVTTDGTRSWAEHDLPTSIPGMAGFSCPTVSRCVLWTGSGFSESDRLSWTTDGGATWTAPAAAPDGSSVQELACATATTCELAGSGAHGVVLLGSTSLGARWAQQPIPVGVVRIESSACTTLTSCVVAVEATQGGAVFHTSDAGASWTQALVPRGTLTVTSATCPSSMICAAAANGLLTSHDGGATWRRLATTLGARTTLDGVACPTATECVLVGGQYGTSDFVPGPRRPGFSVVVRWSHGSLRRVAAPASISPLQSVACAGSTCISVGGQNGGYGPVSSRVSVIVSHDAGATWASSSYPARVSSLTDVTCATARICIAVGQLLERPGTEPGVIETSNAGTTWRVVPTLHRIGQFNSVACTGALACVATGIAGATTDAELTVRVENAARRWTALDVLDLGSISAVGDVGHRGLFVLRVGPTGTRPRIDRLR